ncbi:hypothetical protein HOLleu_22640 [Holothuria leucospilota]|uniref:NACHT domain-containing protein n=1 Tax=Holothuria leucospilota TaxID=206669 RepID=A0A9Q1H7N3_HOLLE|nr:hypothetical protein HOLleu_22640 [Holothuria leucospilota]
MALLSVLVAVSLLSSVSQTCAMTSCPRVVAVEIGTNYSITCTAETSVNDFYWYKGPASEKDLLGKLENGTKSISEPHKNDYDVSRSGALVILNARIIHESRYDLVTFDANDNLEKERVIVNITISPDPPCPLINDCTSCNKCELPQANKSAGILECKVDGSRPLVPLRWKSVSQNGISVTYHPHIQQNDDSTDSWNSSVSLEYNITVPCDSKIILQCVAEDPQHILHSTVSTIEISTDPCLTGTSANLPLDRTATTSSPKSSTVAGFLVPSVFLFVVLVSGCTAIYKYRTKSNAGDAALPLLPLPDSELVQELVQTLKDKSYEKFCYLQPLPWGEAIDIAALYTESLCTVTKNKKTSDIPSNELTTAENITRQRLVIFIGEHGDGRTTFLKHVVYEWVKGREDVFLVIFIPLKEVKTDKTLSKFLIEDILNTRKFKTEHVEAILQSEEKHCLVILDGLEDLPESFQKGETDKRDLHTRNLITIDETLQGRENEKYRNLHVWISSREEDWNSSRRPKCNVKVEMKGFSKFHFSRYVQKSCWHYINQAMSENNIQATEEDNDVYNKVRNFLEENNILKDYKNTPLLVNLMVHAMAAKYASALPYLQDKPITNMGTLIHVVIDCMKQRFVSKNPSFDRKLFSTLEDKLGEIALQHKTKLEVKDSNFWIDKIGKEQVKTACQIGLLKLIKDSPSTARFSGIEFYHQHIQEYLAALFIVKNPEGFSKYEQTIEQCGNGNGYGIKKFIRELNDLQAV